MTTIDVHSLLAPFALDALDADERARFEDHLAQCPTCRSELAGFLETTSRLGEARAEQPPAALRDTLLGQISSTPQERPLVTSLNRRAGLRRTLPRLVAAAVFVVGVAGVGGYALERDRADEANDRSAAITRILGSEDAQTVAKTFPDGGNVRMIVAASEDAAVIVAHDLPSPGAGKVYQVWMIDDSGPIDQGTFVRDGQMIMKGITKADRVAVTVEPEGGSEQPTTAPIATIPV